MSLDAVLTAIRSVAVDEYVEGRSIASLSRQWGIPQKTLSDLMKRRGVYVRRAGGPTRQSHCDKGHDMSVHGKPATNGHGRYCSECRRARERV